MFLNKKNRRPQKVNYIDEKTLKIDTKPQFQRLKALKKNFINNMIMYNNLSGKIYLRLGLVVEQFKALILKLF